ncbi:unnamed protein product [Ilex paraguariensis]|uniref:Uncharacterized protein n=1 Tax=Ilex paraguariensis TaxID=185542 RepID=A0ABC8QVN9_9AQUA
MGIVQKCPTPKSLTDDEAGHGWDVKSVDWHPTKSLLVSGGKDNLVKLWDAKSGRELCSFHGHKNTVLCVKWNQNGNWMLTASKDQIIKLYDIRAMKELESFRGHRKDVTEWNRVGSFSWNKDCVRWLNESFSSALCWNSKDVFLRKYRIDGLCVWIELDSSRFEEFARVSKMLKNGGRMSLIIPKGIEGRGGKHFEGCWKKPCMALGTFCQ